MSIVIVFVSVLVLLLLGMLTSARIVKQYEEGVLFRLGKVVGERKPGFRLIVPFVDVLHRVSLRIVTMPIQLQGIITKDNVSVDVSAVAYFKVVDPVNRSWRSRSLRRDRSDRTDHAAKVVGQHTLDQTLSETDKINLESARSSTSPRSSGASWSRWWSSRTSSCPTV